MSVRFGMLMPLSTPILGILLFLSTGCEDNTRIAVCSNGILEQPQEVCDDGELNGTYGHCNADCSGPGPHCGDGILDEPQESCDEGGLNGTYYHCLLDCSGLGAHCGDGTTDSPDEDCDDGADNGTYDHCNANCDGRGPHCGDGNIDVQNEICDDGDDNGAYGYCTGDCQGRGPFCGDGRVEPGHEACDHAQNNGLCGYCAQDCGRVLSECYGDCLVKHIKINDEVLVVYAYCNGENMEFRFVSGSGTVMDGKTMAAYSIALTAMSHGYKVDFADVQAAGNYFQFSRVGIARRPQP